MIYKLALPTISRLKRKYKFNVITIRIKYSIAMKYNINGEKINL